MVLLRLFFIGTRRFYTVLWHDGESTPGPRRHRTRPLATSRARYTSTRTRFSKLAYRVTRRLEYASMDCTIKVHITGLAHSESPVDLLKRLLSGQVDSRRRGVHRCSRLG